MENMITEVLKDKIQEYDIVFVGGGPATLCFLSYLFKFDYVDIFFKNLNILVLEKSAYFGSGCLGKYGINSNTSAEGFLRIICENVNENKEKAQQALSPEKKPSPNVKSKLDKLDMKSSKLIKPFTKKILPHFTDLFNSPICQKLIEIGSKPAPLTLIGHFLNCVGSSIVQYIHKKYFENILKLQSEVVSITKENDHFKIQYESSSKDRSLIKSKIVVLSSGAKQNKETISYKELTKIIEETKIINLIDSDSFLQENGYSNTVKKLQTIPKVKVVIIGGAHSGFSSAWILLNGPSKSSSDDSTTSLSWKFEERLSNVQISIIYKDQIKVYYHSEKDARDDGYTCYDCKKCVNKNGNVFPFIGIRGDAKELYRKITRGTEKRVRLVKINSSLLEEQNLIKSADLVIWACGYNTNLIKISSSDRNEELNLFKDFNQQLEVDKQLHLLNIQKVPVQNLFGIGQGYSTHSIELLLNGQYARADSINLYNTYIAKKLYKSIEDYIEIKKKKKNSRRRDYRISSNKIVLESQTMKENTHYNNNEDSNKNFMELKNVQTFSMERPESKNVKQTISGKEHFKDTIKYKKPMNITNNSISSCILSPQRGNQKKDSTVSTATKKQVLSPIFNRPNSKNFYYKKEDVLMGLRKTSDKLTPIVFNPNHVISKSNIFKQSVPLGTKNKALISISDKKQTSDNFKHNNLVMFDLSSKSKEKFLFSVNK